MTNHTTAHYFLEGLAETGIEYVFSNLGTDHVSLIEALAEWDRDGRKHPEMVLCPHENVAIHMAGGYAALTGRGQAVMVHVDAGTANAVMGMHNLFRSRLPVFLMAGKAPHTLHGELPGSRDNFVHFVQDPYDIGSLVRPYVKWEYNLPTGVVAKEALRRGHTMMQSDPPGPVYMTLPRETLAESWGEEQIRSYPENRYGAVSVGGADAAMAMRIAERLLAASNPIVITSYLGRKPEAVMLLDALARECGIKVFEFNPLHLNIPRDSPCFAGYDAKAAMAEADLGLLLDVDVPWLPKYVQDKPALSWIQVDIDPVKKDFPMWGFPSDMRLQADCATVLAQVLEIVRQRADAGFRRRVEERIAGWEGERQERRQRIAAAGAEPGGVGAISPDYLCAAIAELMEPDDIVVNEAIRNTFAVLNQIPRSRPQSYVGLAGGGLGFSGGAALGAKLARPKSRVVQVVGDGGFHFSNPTAVYAVAQQYRLPILTVVLDNGGWQAVKEAVLRVYPDGAAAAANDFQARLAGERRDFAQVGAAFGAHAETVDDPALLRDALARCMAALDRGQAAVLCARVTPM
ncbi:acetolactate synthase-1/2/3 large subunit [Noviherbaspirillum humi]|uniref:Acetolactate synthase-1/2/3 large subunit n=1 Tax=Noviherbaspirillum humi TaxID=1688639 RepID=A0A239JW02_9BURK|nr:thiamine pyrophosphate-requiring protein [Noviherbaspirillum humi]SNT10087.1 acetolactate synthase-1/2/3 large subunit [Noviherbaspirillum humi]